MNDRICKLLLKGQELLFEEMKHTKRFNPKRGKIKQAIWFLYHPGRAR